MNPWEDWYHIMCHTYGTWLPGDERGFRSRHHREHVDGDYKNPPPAGFYSDRLEQSKRLMKRDAVYLDLDQQRRAVEELTKSFLKWKIELKRLSVDRVHAHALAKIIDHDPRRWMGIAKKECSAYMKRDGLAPQGGLWAVRCECKPINDRRHLENVDKYILDHDQQGAIVHPPREINADRPSMVNWDLSAINPANFLIE